MTVAGFSALRRKSYICCCKFLQKKLQSFACFAHVEPASPGPDSDSTMDTMEVDSSDLDGSRGLDDPEEPSTPDERMFEMDSPFLDREKDEEPIKTIRCNLFSLNLGETL